MQVMQSCKNKRDTERQNWFKFTHCFEWFLLFLSLRERVPASCMIGWFAGICSKLTMPLVPFLPTWPTHALVLFMSSGDPWYVAAPAKNISGFFLNSSINSSTSGVYWIKEASCCLPLPSLQETNYKHDDNQQFVKYGYEYSRFQIISKCSSHLKKKIRKTKKRW